LGRAIEEGGNIKKERKKERKKEEDASKPVAFKVRMAVPGKNVEGIPGNTKQEEVERILSEKCAVRLRWTKFTRSWCRDSSHMPQSRGYIHTSIISMDRRRNDLEERGIKLAH
jgi:hypothetical protein